MIAFYDACAVIYLLEGHQPFSDQTKTAIGSLEQTYPRLFTAISRLSWLECRTGPLETGDTAALIRYDTFFKRPAIRWIDITKT